MRKRGYIGKFANVDLARFGQFSSLANERFNNQAAVSLKRRVLSIALLGVSGFVLYLSVTITQAYHNQATLREIQSVRYPAQASLLGALHTLEVIQRELEVGVLTSNQDLVQTTAILADDFRQKLIETARLSLERGNDINTILTRFEAYYQSSSNHALEASAAGDDVAHYYTRTRSAAIQYDELKGELSALLNTETQSLSDSMGRAQRFYQYSIWVGYFAGVSGVLLIFLLGWYTANSIVRRINEMVSSLRNIAKGDSDMSARIKLSGSDEMSELAFWFNTFIARLDSVTRKSTAEIRRIAYTDNLSGLPNRRLLMECIEAEKTRCQSDPDRRVAGMFLDLDNFKPVNDQLGHDAGDELIRQVAKRLQRIVNSRELDDDEAFEAMIAGESPVVARIGGDEFFVLVSRGADEVFAESLATRILETVLEPYTIAGEQCHIGVSIGISLYPRDASSSANLMDKADLAMYEAKNCGKNTFRFYSRKITEAAKRKARLENALRESIAKGELRLLFQPKFSLKTGDFCGAEVLLRWHSDEFGVLAPDAFMPFAEASGKTLKIDEWVLRKSCETLQAWGQAGLAVERLAVNVSSHMIRSAECEAIVESAMRDFGVSGEQLELEVTESSANGFAREFADNIAKLRQRGITIALDDFGVGQSSMHLLIGCEIDALKLDRSLIEKLEIDKRTQVVVQSLLSMASSLNVATVAEGLESTSQVQRLRGLGCDMAQGYFFAKPMDREDIEKFISEPANRHLRLVS